MMKGILLFAASGLLAAFLGAANARPEFTCSKWEYAKLKDATKRSLANQVCDASRTEQVNRRLKSLKTDFLMTSISNRWPTSETQKEIDELDAAAATCVEAGNEAAEMLIKRFNTPRPDCT